VRRAQTGMQRRGTRRRGTRRRRGWIAGWYRTPHFCCEWHRRWSCGWHSVGGGSMGDESTVRAAAGAKSPAAQQQHQGKENVFRTLSNMVLQASQLHQPNPSTSERACIVGTTQNQPLPTTRSPTTLLQLTNARHHKGVATAELLLTNRGRLPTSAASAQSPHSYFSAL
jgi:hypothetical protein